MKLSIPDYMERYVGRAEPHVNNGNVNLSVSQYLRIISGKTAALFEASFFTGAVLLERNGCYKKICQVGAPYRHDIPTYDDCMDFEETRNG
jgi:heptaprenyl diphosphate synthase